MSDQLMPAEENEQPAETAAPFSLPEPGRRLPITALIVGGGLLVVMSQAIYARLLPQFRPFIFFLLAAGLLSFTLGGRLVANHNPPARLTSLARSLARFFNISSGQLILLVLAPCFALMGYLAAGEALEALNLPIYLVAWLLSIALVLAGSYRPVAETLSKVDIKELALVSALFLLAFFLRAWAIEAIPATLSGDEGSAGLASLSFASGEANNLLTIGWFSFPSLYFAIQGLGISLLDQTVAGLRITSALAGALTVVAVYWLARSLFDRLTAVLAALLLAAFHYHIHFSRIGLNNIWDGLFAVLVVGGLWYGWKHERRLGFLICGLALGLGQYFYVSIRVFPLLLLLWAGLAFIRDRPKFKRLFPDLLLAAWIAFVVVLPLVVVFTRHPNEFNAPLQRVTIFDGWLDQMVLREGKPAIQIIWDQIINTALGFTHLPLRHWYNPGVPLLLPGAAALFLLGLLWAVTNISLRYLLLLLPLLAVTILGGFSQDAPASQRYVLAVPFVAVLVALPLGTVTNWLQNFWPRFRHLILAGAVLILIWVIYTDLHYYFFEVYDDYILGGHNTLVATEIAHHLSEQEPAPDVYFFGFPRMGYFSLSTIPYIAGDIEAQDVMTPLTAPPAWQLLQTTYFIFLPERLEEKQFVEQQYPGGIYTEFRDEDNTLLYAIYAVNP